MSKANNMRDETDTLEKSPIFTNEMIYELRRYTHDSGGKGTPFKRDVPKIGRNSLCPCGSLLKYKHCCINKKQ